MIVDVRTMLLPSDEPEADAFSPTPESFARAAGCVDVAVVHGWRSERLRIDTPPESIASFTGQDPTRRVGFTGIDPLADTAEEDLARAADLGLAGVTLCPADAGYRPTHDSAMNILERCAARGTPVLAANPWLTDRRSVAEFARPILWDEPLRTIPRLTVILGDAGAGWFEECLLLAARHARVYIELSGLVTRPWSLYQSLQAAVERRLSHKLLFGSGFPRESPAAAIERLYSINSVRQGSTLPAVPREILRSIVERDTLAELGIDVLTGARTRSTGDAPIVHVHADTDSRLYPHVDPAPAGRDRPDAG